MFGLAVGHRFAHAPDGRAVTGSRTHHEHRSKTMGGGTRVHAAKERDSRAITGLSMGGSESLLTGLNNLDKFAWVGAFSAGGLPEPFDKNFPGLEASANQKLHLLWIACGTEDRLITANRNLREWLKTKGIQHTDMETPGMHTWMVWRRNLAEFSGLLFR